MGSSRLARWLSPARLHTIQIWLLYILVFCTPFIFTWVNEELFEFNKMLVVYGVTTLLVATYFTKIILHQTWSWKHTWFDGALGLFLGSQLLATLFSIHQPTSIWGYYTRFHGGLASWVAYSAILLVAVQSMSMSEFKRLLKVSLLSAMLVSVYAIGEHFGISVSCLMITGEANVACWQQDVQLRVFASFGQPNWLAAYLLLHIPLAQYFGLEKLLGRKTAAVLNEKKSQTSPAITRVTAWWLNAPAWLWAGVDILLLFALLATKSRSGLLGLAVALAVQLPIFGWIWFRKRSRALGIKIGVFAITIATLVMLVGLPSDWWQPDVHPSNEAEQTETAPVLVQDQGGTNSGAIRLIVWQGALEVWQKHWLLGTGPETFAYSYYQHRPEAHNTVSEWDFLYNKAHNEILHVLAGSGSIGLLGFIAPWFVATLLVLRSCWQYWRLSPKTSVTKRDDIGWHVTLQATFLGSVGGLFVSNFFGFSTVMVTVIQFLLFAGIAISIRKMNTLMSNLDKTTQTQKKAKENIHIAGTLQLICFGLIWLTAWFIIIKIGLFWLADRNLARAKAYASQGFYAAAVEIMQFNEIFFPLEAVYHERLSLDVARLAIISANSGDMESALGYAQQAILHSQQSLALNPAHLNFYKTQARVYSLIGQLDASYLDGAIATLDQAQNLAPTDPKLIYNTGLLYLQQGKTQEAENFFQQAVAMKPDYAHARNYLGQVYEATQQYDLALEQYQYISQYIGVYPDIEQKIASLSAQLEAGE